MERIVAFLAWSEERVCDRVEPWAGGTVLVTPSLPRVWDLNVARLERELPGDELHVELARALSDVERPKLIVRDAALGARLAPALRDRGWEVTRQLALVHRREPDRRPPDGLAAEVDEAAIASLMGELRLGLPHGTDREIIRQLAERDRRGTRSIGSRDFAAPAEGPHVSNCRLHSDGRVAEIDHVGTLADFRARGLARAVVLAAVDAAVRSGHELVFIRAEADDWPQHLYVKLGFDLVGELYEFVRRPDAPPP
jgi:GNAT superfamily N-acetyltransferase